jgi:hypothetical protein
MRWKFSSVSPPWQEEVDVYTTIRADKVLVGDKIHTGQREPYAWAPVSNVEVRSDDVWIYTYGHTLTPKPGKSNFGYLTIRSKGEGVAVKREVVQ